MRKVVWAAFLVCLFSFSAYVPSNNPFDVTLSVSAPSALAQTQPAEYKPPLKERAKDFALKTAIAVTLICGFIGVIMGFTDRAVFFYDLEDFVISAGPVALFVGFAFLGIFLDWDWLGKFGAVLAIGNIGLIFWRSFKFNPHSHFAAFCTAIGKTILGALVVIKVLDTLAPSGRTTAERRSNQLISLVWVLFLLPLCNRLINGHRVLATVAYEKAQE